MPQGLIAYRANGSVAFDTAHRLGRALAIEPWETSSIPATEWTQVLPAGYAGDAWGIIVPLYPLDIPDYYGGSPGWVESDPDGHPGQIYVQATKDPAYPSILIYGVY